MMMIKIFAQEALLTEMVSRAILKKNTGEHMFPGVIVCPTIHLPVRLRLLGDALTTCKSVSWSQKTHSYMTAGFKPLRGAKRTYELISSIQQKLRIWRWRDLTIIGRIQIKTFIIPIFLYHASLILVNREFVKDVNKMIFDFIWKGKDKIKRSALIGDIEDGGLKAPHLDSIIETQRILCCKKLASDQPSNWKKIVLHYLEPVGGKLILCCDFDLKKLPI